MIEFRVVPLRLEIRGKTYSRGEYVYFEKIFRNGFDNPAEYRLWPKHCTHTNHKPECYEWFTQKQIDAMQPHWISQQEEMDL